MRRIALAPEGWIFTLPPLILDDIALLMQSYFAAIALGAITAFLAARAATHEKVRAGRAVIADVGSAA